MIVSFYLPDEVLPEYNAFSEGLTGRDKRSMKNYLLDIIECGLLNEPTGEPPGWDPRCPVPGKRPMRGISKWRIDIPLHKYPRHVEALMRYARSHGLSESHAARALVYLYLLDRPYDTSTLFNPKVY